MATRLTTLLVIVIVGATFVAGLIVGAQRDDANGPVDLIIVNGKVYPGGGADLQEAIAVRGNQILRVGSNREVKRLRRAQTLVLDAHGASVLPGFNDTDVELLHGALALEQLDLTPVDTTDELASELRLHAEKYPTRPWLLGRNGEAAVLGTANAPARRILDAAVPDRPVFITSDDGQIAWANSKALEAAGITRMTRNPRSGFVVKDRRTGEPTGVLKQAAVDIVARGLPKPSEAEKITALRAAIEEAQKSGVTSVHSASGSDEELELLDQIRQQGDLGLRVYASIAVSPSVTEAAVIELDKLKQQFPDDPALKMGGVMVRCPCSSAQLERAIALLESHGWTVMVDTANGADVHSALDALGKTATAETRERRNRIDDSLLNGNQARILSGSGWPAAPLDPREALADADQTPGDLRNAIDAYTAHAAYASYDEHRKGTLAKGMLADIVILSNDILESEVGAVDETAVTVTIFDGKVVYQRPTTTSSND